MAVPPRKQTVLFVGDLSSVCTEQHIRELFEVNGFMVVDIKMMGGKVTSNSFDYGFVELSTPEEAELALSTLDGTFLCGRRLRVKWAAPNIKNKPSKGIINSVHVRFQSLQPGLLVNEETLLSVFETFGIISDVSVKSCAMNPNNGLHDGYGFVHFPCSPEGVAVALKAVSALTENPIVDNVHYSCEMSKNLLKLLQVQSQKRSQDAYAALNSHLQYSSRYNTHNYQNYALPGQGYMPGSQQAYFRNNTLRRPMDPLFPMDNSRLYGDYSGYAGGGYPAHLQAQQQVLAAQAGLQAGLQPGLQQGLAGAPRKPSYDPLSLVSPHLRPEQQQEEFPLSWAEQQQQQGQSQQLPLTGSVGGAAPLSYEPAYGGAANGGLRVQDAGLPSLPANGGARYPDQLRYSDPRYPSDIRLLEHRTRAHHMGPPPGVPAIPAQRRVMDPRDLRVPGGLTSPLGGSLNGVGVPLSVGAPLGYGYGQSNMPLMPPPAPLGQQMYRQEQHGYAIEDFVDYPYPSEDTNEASKLDAAPTQEDANANKSVDELNELLSRHSIGTGSGNSAPAPAARIY